ncbi:hypothetical protein ACOSQ2_004134 [Xanthoceras sorbifolium]
MDADSDLPAGKTVPSWTEKVRVSHGNELQAPLDDGYSWRKYRQKDILGAKYPRNTRGSLATKQVQRSDEDSTMFEVTYRGAHTRLTPDGSSSSEFPKFQ